MKKLLTLSFLSLFLLNLNAQKQKAFFEIAGHEISFSLGEKAAASQEAEKSKIIYIKFLNDSSCVFKKPVSCYVYDTVTQIDPVSQEEETHIEIDSTVTTKFNLGSVSKTELGQSVSNQLGLGKNGFDFKLKTLTLCLFDNKCDSLVIDCQNPADIQTALQKIQTLHQGSSVIIGKVGFENTDERDFYGEFDNIALMKIKE